MTKNELITTIRDSLVSGKQSDAENAIDKYCDEYFTKILTSGFNESFRKYDAEFKKDNSKPFQIFPDQLP